MWAFRIVFVLILFSISALAQKSLLAGTVYDMNGAVVQKVVVTATNSKGAKFKTVTNDDGEYVISLAFSFDEKDKYGSMKYTITFERKDIGFQDKVIRDFIFVSAPAGKMYLDCVLEARRDEPTFQPI